MDLEAALKNHCTRKAYSRRIPPEFGHFPSNKKLIWNFVSGFATERSFFADESDRRVRERVLTSIRRVNNVPGTVEKVAIEAADSNSQAWPQASIFPSIDAAR